MRKKKMVKGLLILSASIGAVVACFGFLGNARMFAFSDQVSEEKKHVPQAKVVEEEVSKRSKFTKGFIMSDGSHLGAIYSMPVNYKKNGVWKEVDTNLKKKGKYYQTKQTDLSIKLSKYSGNKKETVKLNRGKYKVSFFMVSNKKTSAKIFNRKKKEATDVINESKVKYSNILKNASVVYEIYPEKITEIIYVKSRKAKNKFSYQYKNKGLKMKGNKSNRVFFKTKKGKILFTRLKTIITDAAGVTTKKVKVTVNKNGKIKVAPDKKWIKSKKRKYPLQIRTAIITNKHSKDVKVASSYSGASEANYIYDSDLIVKPSKGDVFIKTETLPERNNSKVKVLGADLHIDSKSNISMGATKTFNIDVHEVNKAWTAKKVSYNNRPGFNEETKSGISISKAGRYKSDISELVKGWYQGKPNYGMALIANNSNGVYEARLSKNPYVTVRYEIPSFEGAKLLKENIPESREILKDQQENYFSFYPKKDIAYEICTLGKADTRITLYDASKKRIAYDDNSSDGINAKIIRGFKEAEGKIFAKITAKKGVVGSYKLLLKKRYGIPFVKGERKADSYQLNWNKILNAKEYIVKTYDSTGVIREDICKESKYSLVFTNRMREKTLGFTVIPRESESLYGEESRMIYTQSADSDWIFSEPLPEYMTDLATVGDKDCIYLLGGNGEAKLYKYEVKKKLWKCISIYPDAKVESNFSLVLDEDNLYVFGGKKEDGTLSNNAYSYNIKEGEWKKLADMPQERSNIPTAVLDKKIYLFSKCGDKNSLLVYDCNKNEYDKKISPGTSDILAVCTIDDTIYALREKGSEESASSRIFVSEYNEKEYSMEEDYDDLLAIDADNYTSLVGLNGKLYIASENKTRDVLVFDTYKNEWDKLSKMNLNKSHANYVISGNFLYSIGGEMEGFGIIDVCESLDLKLLENAEILDVKKGELYEIS